MNKDELIKKAKANDIQTMIDLGYLYLDEEKYKDAVKLFEKAISLQGDNIDLDLVEILANIYCDGCLGNGNKSKCLKYYEILSNNGDLVATTILGVSYMDGRNGAKEDIKKGLEYYYKSANGGWIYGMVNLGLYLCDNGNHVEGIAWFKKASEIDEPGLHSVAVEAYVFYKKYKRKFKDQL